MGRGSENTLRIDEPLHFMFLVAYLITYFCCAYLLFVCFKHCRRLLKRKPERPSRIRNLDDVVSNFHFARQRRLRNIQVTLQQSSRGGVSSAICNEYGGTESDQLSQFSFSDMDQTNETTTTTSRTSLARFGRAHLPAAVACLLVDREPSNELPSYYDSISDEESPPPSYSECVPNQSPLVSTRYPGPVTLDLDNIIILKTKPTNSQVPPPPVVVKPGRGISQTTSCPSMITN